MKPTSRQIERCKQALKKVPPIDVEAHTRALEEWRAKGVISQKDATKLTQVLQEAASVDRDKLMQQLNGLGKACKVKKPTKETVEWLRDGLTEYVSDSLKRYRQGKLSADEEQTFHDVCNAVIAARVQATLSDYVPARIEKVRSL